MGFRYYMAFIPKRRRKKELRLLRWHVIPGIAIKRQQPAGLGPASGQAGSKSNESNDCRECLAISQYSDPVSIVACHRQSAAGGVRPRRRPPSLIGGCGVSGGRRPRPRRPTDRLPIYQYALLKLLWSLDCRQVAGSRLPPELPRREFPAMVNL